ncbi:MAG: 3-hydroxyacyl-CoA dehydrogenase family protein [Acidobacteriota bacterium]
MTSGRQIRTLVVLGAGTMGRGIAQMAAMAGYRTLLFDLEDSVLAEARAAVLANLDKGRKLGKVSPQACELATRLLETTTDFGRAASECDFLIEAIPEKMSLKSEALAQFEKCARPGTVFATNTSSLSITELAAGAEDPGRVIGMHFFNPVHLMKLVEIVRGAQTSAETFATTEAVARQMGKETVDVKESPGFVTSRVNALIGNEAFYMLQEGIASARDIDRALKLGLNHPMGPFEMVDLVGLDTRLSVLNFLHERLGEKYRPCPLLVQYVADGRLGRKVGRGVYEY